MALRREYIARLIAGFASFTVVVIFFDRRRIVREKLREYVYILAILSLAAVVFPAVQELEQHLECVRPLVLILPPLVVMRHLFDEVSQPNLSLIEYRVVELLPGFGIVDIRKGIPVDEIALLDLVFLQETPTTVL